VTSTVTAAPMAATAATCHSHRGGKEKRDHGDEDAAAAHGSLHRRSVARQGATGEQSTANTERGLRANANRPH